MQTERREQGRVRSFKWSHMHYLIDGTAIQVYKGYGGAGFVWEDKQFWRLTLWLLRYYARTMADNLNSTNNF